MIKISPIIFIAFLFCFTLTSVSLAADGKYITIVHPVRAKNYWQSIDSVRSQIDLAIENNLPVTWLVQYSAIDEQALVDLFKKLPRYQEIGIFWEVDEKLATDALAGYIIGSGDWARADKILLSGYSIGERKRIIDTVFGKFKKVYGYYPSSVGAWYIDTISLNYMVDRYKIKAVLDVADQYQTDGYGVWGKPWGTPYYPSRTNSLIPSQTIENNLDIVKIQWAQRDPVKGYGLTVADSTYSMQANDYVGHHGLDNNYFKTLSGYYLHTPNTLSQLTIGLETGQEAASFFDEYSRQIKTLIEAKNKENLNFVTMSDFAKRFKLLNPTWTPNFLITGNDGQDKERIAFWFSTPFYRVGFVKEGDKLRIRDLRDYDENLVFDDIFGKDKNWVLKRIIPASIDEHLENTNKYLIGNIKNFTIDRKGEDLVIETIDGPNGQHKIRLTTSSIWVDDEILLNAPVKTALKDKIRGRIYWLLVNYSENLYHGWKIGFRWSLIDNIAYYGLWIFPEKLIGIKSSFPYIGAFNFPFQVLASFKTLPKIL